MFGSIFDYIFDSEDKQRERERKAERKRLEKQKQRRIKRKKQQLEMDRLREAAGNGSYSAESDVPGGEEELDWSPAKKPHGLTSSAITRGFGEGPETKYGGGLKSYSQDGTNERERAYAESCKGNNQSIPSLKRPI